MRRALVYALVLGYGQWAWRQGLLLGKRHADLDARLLLAEAAEALLVSDGGSTTWQANVALARRIDAFLDTQDESADAPEAR